MYSRVRALPIGLLVVCLPLAACTLSHPSPAARIGRDVAFLADDSLEGRLTGSDGERLAAAYLSRRFAELGLEPPFSSRYRQEFEFKAGARVLEGSGLRVAGREVSLRPLGFSSNGSVRGTLCYAGYGVAGNGRNDYENLDVEGRIVLARFRLGSELSAASRRELSSYMPPRYRAFLAKRHGAVGIVFFDDAPRRRHRPTAYASGDAEAIGAAVLRRSDLAIALPDFDPDVSHKKDSVKEPVHGHSSSACEPGVEATLSTRLEFTHCNGINVAAILPASAPTSAEPGLVVVGAHYDHLGRGEFGSLYDGDDDPIHNGADDNASGTAAVLELARRASDIPARRHDILFVLFSGEEMGLVGSTELLKRRDLLDARGPIKAMLNFDMVGRLDRVLSLQGTGSAAEWETIIARASAKLRHPPQVNTSANPYLPTDAMSFYVEKIPVLNFFTGAHEQYHKPDDDVELVNNDGIATVVDYAYEVLSVLSAGQRLAWKETPREKQSAKSGMLQVYLGTIPDYTADVDGLRLNGVRGDSPAARAGLERGDVVVSVADTAVHDVYDYTYALAGALPGEELLVVVVRDGETVELRVIPEAR